MMVRHLLIVSLVLGSAVAAQERTADPVKRGFKESDFPRSIQLADNVYAYEDLRSAGDERFTTVSMYVITSDGVLVADGQGSVEATKRLVDEIARKTSQPIGHVVVCSDHGDHTAGNAAFPPSATFYAHPTSQKVVKMPTTAVPDKLTLTLGATDVQLLFLGRAHTGGDLSVYLPKEKVLFMSEAFLNRVFPAMRSAYPSEWVATVKKALTMDVQTYVPGHGFVEQPRVSREELQNAGKALEFVIGAVRPLHASKTPLDEATKKVDWGPYRDWRLVASQGPIAVRKVYDELDGKLK